MITALIITGLILAVLWLMWWVDQPRCKICALKEEWFGHDLDPDRPTYPYDHWYVPEDKEERWVTMHDDVSATKHLEDESEG